MQPVITSAAIQRISTIAAGKNIGQHITQQTISTGTSLDILNARQRIKPGRAGRAVAHKAYRDRAGLGKIIGEIRAKPTNQPVIAITTGKMVITNAAIQRVSLGITNHPVITIATNHAVSASATMQPVITSAAIQRVSTIATHKCVVASSTRQAIRKAIAQ